MVREMAPAPLALDAGGTGLPRAPAPTSPYEPVPCMSDSRQKGVETPRGSLLAGISAIAREDWRRCRPDDAEGWDYLVACESGTPAAFTLAAAQVEADGAFLAGVPLFTVGYRLDTPFQEEADVPAGGGIGTRLARLGKAFARALVRGQEWRLLAVGSPFTESCPLALDPGLDGQTRGPAVAELLRTVEAEARRQKAGLIAFKDIDPPTMERVGPTLAAAGYVALESLPHAVLDLAGVADVEGWLARLSSATRKDLKRKLKRAGRVEVEWRSSITGLEEEVRALYDATRAQSHVRYGDFEDLPDGYFANVAAAQPDRVAFAFYRVDGRLAAFNLMLIEPDRVIDKFLGMAYPLARENDLYAVSWAENVRFCQRLGRRYLQTGQTAYASKLRYGSGLVPSTIMVKHLNPVLHAAVRRAAPWFGFPRWDPDLAAHRHRKGHESS